MIIEQAWLVYTLAIEISLYLGVSKYLEEMDWVIVASKNASEAFAPVMYLRNVIIVIGSTGIVVIVFVAVYISTNITGSIEKTSDMTRRIVRSRYRELR